MKRTYSLALAIYLIGSTKTFGFTETEVMTDLPSADEVIELALAQAEERDTQRLEASYTFYTLSKSEKLDKKGKPKKVETRRFINVPYKGHTHARLIEIDGAPVGPDINEAVRRGLAYLSEDRAGKGLFLGRSVIENTTIVSLRRYTKGLIRRAAEREATLARAAELSIKIARPDDPIDTLSGGNQQKVALAKWLQTDPQILLLDEPTRGVDVGAKQDVYGLMNEWTSRGIAIILITSEMPELLAMSDRILVMHRGRATAELSGEEATADRVLEAAMGKRVETVGG